MKGTIAAVVLCALALSACTSLAEKNPPANPFPASTDVGLGLQGSYR